MPNNHTQQIVNKAWSFAHVLRDDGLSYMAYTEQITFLLFLKMAHEQTQPPWNRAPIVPVGMDWPSLLTRDGWELELHYSFTSYGSSVHSRGCSEKSSRKHDRRFRTLRP